MDQALRTRLTMRVALAFGLPSLARGIGRMRRAGRVLLDRSGHEAGRGNVVTAAAFVVLYLTGV